MPTVRVMQEGSGVFENLPATCARFSEQTGIEVEVTLTVIPEMWELMERSFSGEDPPFDLVGVDDLLLIQAARAGHVEPLDAFIAADAYALDDFTSQALAAVSARMLINAREVGLPISSSDVKSTWSFRRGRRPRDCSARSAKYSTTMPPFMSKQPGPRATPSESTLNGMRWSVPVDQTVS